MRKVATIILAAGASRRLGQPKQLVRFGPETLLERALRIAVQARCSPVVVVLGAGAEAILAQSCLAAASIVLNPDWEEGMASSVRAAVRSLGPEIEAALLMTCDQPAVTPEHLERLAAEAPEAPVASSYAGRRGVPAYFPASAFPELLRLTGDAGARRLLASARALDLPGGELDVDTPESLAEAHAMAGERTRDAEKENSKW